MSVSGSLKKVTIAGVTYPVSSDSNAEFNISAFEKENMATSGDSVTKVTKISQNVAGIELVLSEQEGVVLGAIVDSLEDVPFSVTTASGKVFMSYGQVNSQSWSTEENKGPIDLLPRSGFKPWALF